MKIKITIRSLLGVSLLCGAGLAARADDTVTFQVDMSRFTNAAGLQAATNVEVRGGFNSWNGGSKLINNGANVYTNTFPVVGTAGATFQYKYTFQYWTAGVNWEDNNPPNDPGQPADAGNNRVLSLVGGAQTLPATPFYGDSISVPLSDPPLAPVNPVKFQVDMSRYTNGSGGPAFSAVSVQGDFNGWSGGHDLVAAGGGIYTNVFDLVSTSPGAATSWKYTFTAPNGLTWEDSIGGTNRSFIVAGGPALQTLPLVPFYAPGVGVPLEFVTNNITFQVNMAAQGQAFLDGGGSVTVSGNFNGWGNGNLMTNDPAAPYPTNWIYKYTAPNVVYQKYFPSFPALAEFNGDRFKFRANGGWENATFSHLWNTDDRAWSATNSGPNLVLPLVSYSDATLCDILPWDTTVTYVLHITNGTWTTTGHQFDNTVDTIHINGDSVLGSWQPWNFTLPQLVNDPVGSDYYSVTLTIPAGRSRAQNAKYGIDFGGSGTIDNEAPQNDNHLQWIRSTNDVVVMSPVEWGTNYESSRRQINFGNLKASAPVAGKVPVTWDGCGCVTLQSATSLNGGTWTDKPETDGLGSTNIPMVGNQQFFRLTKRLNP